VKFSAWFSIIVGMMMFLQWSFFLVAGQVPELQTEPVRIAFHLVAEFLTAIGLIIGGVFLIKNKPWSRSLLMVAAGMLAYTTVVSPGYFAQQGVWPIVLMFAVVFALNVVNILLLVRERRN
jgi:hypothetical protein